MTNPYFGSYLEEIGEYPLLNKKKEVRLGKKIRKWKDMRKTPVLWNKASARIVKAREELIEKNLRLVVNVAKNYRGLDSIDELVAEGNLCLVQTAENYNPERGRFTTVLFHALKNCYSNYHLKKVRQKRGKGKKTPSLNNKTGDAERIDFIPDDSLEDPAEQVALDIDMETALKFAGKREGYVLKEIFFKDRSITEITKKDLERTMPIGCVLKDRGLKRMKDYLERGYDENYA
jgi:RNA polymerase sigma factor (sigma-70 family)